MKYLVLIDRNNMMGKEAKHTMKPWLWRLVGDPG